MDVERFVDSKLIIIWGVNPGVTGIHLMRTGEVEANLSRLNETFRLPYIADLIDRKLAGRAFTWHSKAPTVATVDAEGTVKGIAPGTAAIIANCDGKEGIVSVSVPT